jgi:hypothetical protein
MSQKEIDAYILQLSPMEKQILNIAKTHLETSFSLVKSIGFQEWQAEQAQAEAEQAQAEQAQAASMPPAPPSSKT